MPWIVQNLWLIPALPVLAAGLSALLKQRHRKTAASLAIGSMGLSFLLSLCAFTHVLTHEHGGKEFFNFRWFQFSSDQWVQIGWVLDPLTAVMLVMVTFVGTLIFVYSVGYMSHDKNFTRFFCFLSLFAGAMLGVVIANSLLLLFICWELVGLTSYLLIGFWYHKPSAAAAAKKAFVTTRIGDVAFFIGIVWLYSETNTLLFYDVEASGCLEQGALTKLVARTTSIGLLVSNAISLLIFAGAVGKSGQVPLHVWLPDAMEGPTPVSALIHAATMVAAGVFLVARVYPMMEAPANYFPMESERPSAYEFMAPAPGAAAPQSTSAPVAYTHEGEMSKALESATIRLPALEVVTWIGAITALFAASIAMAQTDIKRILAYSTVSQLGYMMMGLGVGGVAVGMFHLITHAFFKALLFMGAGSVIHGSHDEQDIRRMGNLRKFMPVTFATYAVGMMALCGVPLFFSGFWSKDEILHAAQHWEVSKIPFYLGLLGAMLTAFYMTRQVLYVFFGSHRGGQHEVAHAEKHAHEGAAKLESPHVVSCEPHESPRVMTVPLIILAVCTVLLSLIGTPAWPWFHDFITGHHASFDLNRFKEGGIIPLMVMSTVVVALGIFFGWWLYGRQPAKSADEPDPLERFQPDIYWLLRNKFIIDEIYGKSVIVVNAWWSRVCDWLDRWVWNGVVQLVSYVVLGLSWVNRFVDEFVVNLGFDQGCRQLTLGGKVMSRLQDGRVQNYLRVIGVALAALALLLIWGWRGS